MDFLSHATFRLENEHRERKMSVLLDLSVDNDDVLVGFNRRFIPYMNTVTGENLTYDEFHSFDFGVMYPDIPQKEMFQHVVNFVHTLHDTIEPEEGAVEGMYALREIFRTHLNTSRCESTRDITADLLSQHKFARLDSYNFTNSVSLLPHVEKRKKSDICKLVGAVAHIEDAAHHANEVTLTLGIPVVMPLRPWNREEEIAPGVIPSQSWEHTVDILGEIAEKLLHP